MTRYEEMREILSRGRYFKVVCGAGNEDPEEVRKLSLIYTLAGALGIDVSAQPAIVAAAVQGIALARQLGGDLGVPAGPRPFITVSVGLKGDPHIRKAQIDAALCTQCGECRQVCEQQAVDESCRVLARCIGCGACFSVCDFQAISFADRKVDFQEVLPQCLEAGAENLELHATIADDAAVMRDWQLIASLVPHNFISMCLDRSQLSDAHLIARIKQVKAVAGDRLIIQADGIPMSGGRDDFNTTLQAIAIADVIRKHEIPLMLLASGGTNSKTGELARQCGVRLNGISVGTFARKLVRQEINDPRFGTDLDLAARALSAAKALVGCNLGPIAR
ncbi:MAG: 4Fe-4S binding protein [Syntrophobacterales bacterium]|jgi:Fe-S-cluster-containing hydrogenase component 2|nr:4Fe-4S binding protein [Syntrophobacterales bacterium]